MGYLALAAPFYEPEGTSYNHLFGRFEMYHCNVPLKTIWKAQVIQNVATQPMMGAGASCPYY